MACTPCIQTHHKIFKIITLDNTQWHILVDPKFKQYESGGDAKINAGKSQNKASLSGSCLQQPGTNLVVNPLCTDEVHRDARLGIVIVPPAPLAVHVNSWHVVLPPSVI